jgi:acyl dehydratase
LDFSTLKAGDTLPTLVVPPISRYTLAMFAGGSGDHNPMHIDSDFAKSCGMPDVFAQGMLSMAYLAQLLTNSIDQSQLRSYGVRFAAITPLKASVTCIGTVADIYEEDGEKRIRFSLSATIDNGTVTLAGDAVIALNN